MWPFASRRFLKGKALLSEAAVLALDGPDRFEFQVSHHEDSVLSLCRTISVQQPCRQFSSYLVETTLDRT